MEHFVTTLPQTLIGWFTLLGLIVVGGYNVWLAFFNKKKEVEEEADKASDRLIKVLKDQVDALERKVTEQETLLKETKERLETLISENKLLRDVLQGKDEKTAVYQTKALEAIEIAPKILEIVTRTEGSVDKLVGRTVVETKTTKVKRI